MGGLECDDGSGIDGEWVVVSSVTFAFVDWELSTGGAAIVTVVAAAAVVVVFVLRVVDAPEADGWFVVVDDGAEVGEGTTAGVTGSMASFVDICGTLE